ncbi:MAG: hypothetical protein PHC69_05330 [Ruminiclostridium sp.]|nr:hypothetical protein [Ruminiclostridium sp.]
MGEIFKVAGAIIASIGGAGAVLFGLSSWLGKVWANRILEKEKRVHTEQLEKYKSELSKQIEFARSENEKRVFISRVQFEKEFQIYLEIWEALFDLYLTTYNLFPVIDHIPSDEEKKLEEMKKRYEEYCTTYNTFSRIHNKFAPFYKKDLFEKLKSFRALTHTQGITFCMYVLEDAKMEKDVHRETYDNTKKLVGMLEDLQNDFREYLDSLKNVVC